jgi:hypothetical protein
MNKLSNLAKQVVSDFTIDSVDPTESLSKIAQREMLNAQEIERVANRANRKIAVMLTKQAASGDLDPHFIFPVIKTANVIMALKPRPSSAVPSAPPEVSKKISLSEVFKTDMSPSSDLRSTIGDSPTLLAENARTMDAPSREIAIQALNILRSKARMAKAKLSQSEIRIENLINEFKKHASHELLAGTPIEVMDSLPSSCSEHVEKVASQLEEWGHKITRSEEEYDINPDHPIMKIAQDIALFEIDCDQAKQDLEEINKDIEAIRNKK